MGGNVCDVYEGAGEKEGLLGVHTVFRLLTRQYAHAIKTTTTVQVHRAVAQDEGARREGPQQGAPAGAFQKWVRGYDSCLGDGMDVHALWVVGYGFGVGTGVGHETNR